MQVACVVQVPMCRAYYFSTLEIRIQKGKVYMDSSIRTRSFQSNRKNILLVSMKDIISQYRVMSNQTKTLSEVKKLPSIKLMQVCTNGPTFNHLLTHNTHDNTFLGKVYNAIVLNNYYYILCPGILCKSVLSKV